MVLHFPSTVLNSPLALLWVCSEGRLGTWAQFANHSSGSSVNKVDWTAGLALVDGMWKHVKETPWSCLSLIIGTPEGYLILIKMPNCYPLSLITVVLTPVKRGTAGLSHIHRKPIAIEGLAISSPGKNLQNYKPSKLVHFIQPFIFLLPMHHSPVHIALQMTIRIKSISVCIWITSEDINTKFLCKY